MWGFFNERDLFFTISYNNGNAMLNPLSPLGTASQTVFMESAENTDEEVPDPGPCSQKGKTPRKPFQRINENSLVWSLKEDQQESFVKCLLELDLSHSQIAKQLEISNSALSKILKRIQDKN